MALVEIIARSTIHADGVIYGPGDTLEMEESDVEILEAHAEEVGRELCERITERALRKSKAPGAPGAPANTKKAPGMEGSGA